MRIRVLVVGFLAMLGVLFLNAGPAAADEVDDIAAALKSTNLYVGNDLGDISVDKNSAAASLNDQIKVVVLGNRSGNLASMAKSIGQKLSNQDVTVAVFAGTRYGAGSHRLGTNCAAIAISRAVDENLDQLKQTRDLTSTIQRFATLAKSAPTGGSCTTAKGGSTGGGTIEKKSNSGSGWAVLGVLGLVGAGGVGALIMRRKRKDRQALSDARALIQPYYDQLASDINTIIPGDNEVARQAMSDASQRFTSGGSQLSTATSLAQLGGARRSILEGLQATRTARTALGLDPGPELPPLVETTAPQLSDHQQLNVNGQTVQGYPNYTPGAPYYFAGGGGYAGGWYSMPFWQTLLIAEALSPGWGWGFGGGWGGYGGYGAGYNAGYEQGSSQSGDSGSTGDWGGGGGWGGDWSSSGGDWGGGGGDWGGGGGGGDW